MIDVFVRFLCMFLGVQFRLFSDMSDLWHHISSNESAFWKHTVDFMSSVRKFVKGEVRMQRLVASAKM